MPDKTFTMRGKAEGNRQSPKLDKTQFWHFSHSHSPVGKKKLDNELLAPSLNLPDHDVLKQSSPEKSKQTTYKTTGSQLPHLEMKRNLMFSQIKRQSYRDRLLNIEAIVRKCEELCHQYGYFYITCALVICDPRSQHPVSIWIHPNQNASSPLHPIRKKDQVESQMEFISNLKFTLHEIFPTVNLGSGKDFTTILAHIADLKIFSKQKTIDQNSEGKQTRNFVKKLSPKLEESQNPNSGEKQNPSFTINQSPKFIKKQSPNSVEKQNPSLTMNQSPKFIKKQNLNFAEQLNQNSGEKQCPNDLKTQRSFLPKDSTKTVKSTLVATSLKAVPKIHFGVFDEELSHYNQQEGEGFRFNLGSKENKKSTSLAVSNSICSQNSPKSPKSPRRHGVSPQKSSSSHQVFKQKQKYQFEKSTAIKEEPLKEESSPQVPQLCRAARLAKVMTASGEIESEFNSLFSSKDDGSLSGSYNYYEPESAKMKNSSLLQVMEEFEDLLM